MNIKDIIIDKTIVLFDGYEYKVINTTANKKLIITALNPIVIPKATIVNVNQIQIVDANKVKMDKK